MSKWISVEDELPEDGQHVIVYDDGDNLLPFPTGHPGDDGRGRLKKHGAIFLCGDAAWERMVENGHAKNWDFSREKYQECGNEWNRWQGVCGLYFRKVTRWQSMPE